MTNKQNILKASLLASAALYGGTAFAAKGDLALKADLAPINARYTHTQKQTGKATVVIRGNKIFVKLMGEGLDPSIMHMAHIHKGSSCPTLAKEDANKDGVLDVVEGIPSYGLILINFGADISSLAKSKLGGMPMADDKGVINYVGSGDYTELLKDLRDRPAMPAGSGIGKLGSRETFRPEMGVIVVHGVAANTVLPATAKGVSGATPQGSLPVLCGRLESANF